MDIGGRARPNATHQPENQTVALGLRCVKPVKITQAAVTNIPIQRTRATKDGPSHEIVISPTVRSIQAVWTGLTGTATLLWEFNGRAGDERPRRTNQATHYVRGTIWHRPDTWISLPSIPLLDSALCWRSCGRTLGQFFEFLREKHEFRFKPRRCVPGRIKVSALGDAL
jgi:hypothetical protein